MSGWRRWLMDVGAVIGLRRTGAPRRRSIRTSRCASSSASRPAAASTSRRGSSVTSLQKKWGQTIVIESRAGREWQHRGGVRRARGTRRLHRGLGLERAHRDAEPAQAQLRRHQELRPDHPGDADAGRPGRATSLPARPCRNSSRSPARSRASSSYASVGTGGAPFLEMEMLMKQTGIKFNHVPYKGGGDAVISVLGRHHPGLFRRDGDDARSNRLRSAAAARAQPDQRSPKLPDVPTVAEAAGLERFDAADSQWTGLLAPTGTPKPIVDKLHKDFPRH